MKRLKNIECTNEEQLKEIEYQEKRELEKLEGGSHLRIPFWHLLMNLKNK